MADPQQTTVPGRAPVKHTFPDPSLTMVEFGDALGILLAERTERDTANRRIVLKKVAYIRFQEDGWGGVGLTEIWVEQDRNELFHAIEPKSGKVLRYPSRRRYEVAFLSREIFDCAIQCLRERQAESIYELVVVNFGTREGFSVEGGNLLTPEDYASERQPIDGVQWLDTPPIKPVA